MAGNQRYSKMDKQSQYGPRPLSQSLAAHMDTEDDDDKENEEQSGGKLEDKTDNKMYRKPPPSK